MVDLNLSILAIPAYHALALLPHAAAIHIVSGGGKLAAYDNRNPRSTSFKQGALKRLSPQQYATWERLEACHANAFENQAYFYAAILAGNLAGLHKIEGSDGLSYSAGLFLAIRAAYTLVYALNDNQAKSAVRSLLYFASLGVLVKIFWQSAKALAE